MKVLVIPEDPTLDQFILKPVVEQLFADIGKTARVEVLAEPRLRGVDQALDGVMTAHIVRLYPMVALFLTLVDRDGLQARARDAAAREQEHPGKLFVCLAIEEIEVWMLALHRGRLDARWNEVRAERNPKERFAQPFLKANAPKVDRGIGDGRKWAMRGIGLKWKGVLEVCPELAELQERIARWSGLT